MTPFVLNESETFKLVKSGMSLSRYGDGEFKLIFGRNCKTQKYVNEMVAPLSNILKNPIKNLLVGIPNIYNELLYKTLPKQKKMFWKKYKKESTIRLLNEETVYGSSFAVRVDNAPWITCDGMYRWRTIWEDKIVIRVQGNVKWEGSLIDNAKKTHIVDCPKCNAYSKYKMIFREIVKKYNKYNADMVVLYLGPTATVLAADLCKKGIQAIDLGSYEHIYNVHCREQ